MDKSHLLKRRRPLDDGSILRTLSRPFKSPLRQRTEQHEQSHVNYDDCGSSSSHNENSSAVPVFASATQNEHQEGVHISQIRDTASPNPGHNGRSVLSLQPATLARNPLETKYFSGLAQANRTSKDPGLSELQQDQQRLQAHLTSLRAELDTVKQALRIERTTSTTVSPTVTSIGNSSRNEELEFLSTKWRNVSRKAADELFASASERVRSMGGVKAWKDKMGASRGESSAWGDGTDEYDEQNTFERESASYHRSKNWPSSEIQHSQNTREQKDQDELFTMDLMLASLNVPLDLIGFDKSYQEWTT